MAQVSQTYEEKSPGVFRRYRWKELSLFIVPFLILLLSMTQLLLANQDPNSTLSTKNLPLLDGLIPIFGLIAAYFGANVVLSIFFRKADQILLPLICLLSGLGIVMVTRLGPDLKLPSMGSRQLLWVLLGIGVCLGVMFILRNIRWLARYKYLWALFGIGVLIPSVAKGILTFRSADSTPTRDVLGVGGFGLQPSELSKIAIIIFFAAYLYDNRDILAQGYFRLGGLRLPPLRQLGPLVLMLGVALMIFLVVRDLGLALLIYTSFLCMMYLANGKISFVVVNLLVFAVLAFIGYSLLGYVQRRFEVVGANILPPWTADKEAMYQKGGGSFQIVQGLIALSSGGVMGSGLGLGGAGFVPVVDSDSILVAFGEELGLAGLFGIIGIYLLIIHRGFRISAEARNPFEQLLAAGLTSIFAIQTLIISAGNLKIIPLTGIPLPYLSNGGSSIIANFIIIGILLRISHNTAVERDGPD